ncbi:hypothetical protein MMK62_004466 [Pseudomonas aeruginosa]|uniref:hypothetical protein n=1 Tax=Pseudomonas aeruginosa TaxID=287 RepID=UPI00071BC334|nr:hypothetical protein [Pseudomonas aeruginosa]EIU4987540.1 SlyX family protein [Pseudomonas aeruginosa]EIY2610629.1 hypothetical protein [Pseudomonas aeruginosa]EIY2741370.1 hypothetical protein [Pseudomonas aeruginosa]EKM0197038.1 hypothetical protein [Pseudomonas aeruginosa]EKM0220167.1 hypothetical protein [Pseudomonas aeruginosa]
MKFGGVISSGLSACEEALQRLLVGKPIVPEHVGLDLSKLTASIVSLEAGFDRGYLKKSRKAHLPLLAQIESARAGASKGASSSNGKRIRQLENKLASLEKELSVAQEQRDKVLAQNLKLWERLREVECSMVGGRSAKVEILRRPD